MVKKDFSPILVNGARFRRRTEVHAHAVRQGILFVSHDAARAGAQIELLHFLRWFKRNVNRPFSMMLGAAVNWLQTLKNLRQRDRCASARESALLPNGSETGVKTAISLRAECR